MVCKRQSTPTQQTGIFNLLYFIAFSSTDSNAPPESVFQNTKCIKKSAGAITKIPFLDNFVTRNTGSDLYKDFWAVKYTAAAAAGLRLCCGTVLIAAG